MFINTVNKSAMQITALSGISGSFECITNIQIVNIYITCTGLTTFDRKMFSSQ